MYGMKSYLLPGIGQRFVKSSSVVMVRPAQNKSISSVESDYEILLCRRHDKTAFGGFYAFPGGRIDK